MKRFVILTCIMFIKIQSYGQMLKDSVDIIHWNPIGVKVELIIESLSNTGYRFDEKNFNTEYSDFDKQIVVWVNSNSSKIYPQIHYNCVDGFCSDFAIIDETPAKLLAWIEFLDRNCQKQNSTEYICYNYLTKIGSTGGFNSEFNTFYVKVTLLEDWKERMGVKDK